MRHRSWIALFTLALVWGGWAAPAKAQQPRFAVVNVANKLDGKLTLYVRWVWPNGKVQYVWGKFVIPAGKSQTFYYPYDGAGTSSPNVFVRFDTERDKGTHYWEYKLTRGASPDHSDGRYGHKYEVYYVNKRKEFAELRAVTKGAKADLTDRKSSVPPVGK